MYDGPSGSTNDAQIEDLLEQHAEIRPRVIDAEAIHQHNRSQLASRPGAYEWWELCAFNETGTGIVVRLSRADPFVPRYRHAVIQHMAGRPADSVALQATSYPSLHCAVFQERQLIASTHLTGGGNQTLLRCETPTSDGAEWSIALEEMGHWSQDGVGWRLVLHNVPARRSTSRRIWPFAIRRHHADETVIDAEINLQPAFTTPVLQRASMPDGPDGSTHEWLCACPSGNVQGRVGVTSAATDTRSRNAPDRTEINLDGCTGGLEHFWGTGLVGHGMRRWYRAAMRWERGAVLSELPVIRKYIQLAGTSMRFAPGELPMVVRCDHQRTKVFQRSAWLLAHPLELRWAREELHLTTTHTIESLHDAQPFRGFALTEARDVAGRPPDHILAGPMVGTFELIQPARADWRIWRSRFGSRIFGHDARA